MEPTMFCLPKWVNRPKEFRRGFQKRQRNHPLFKTKARKRCSKTKKTDKRNRLCAKNKKGAPGCSYTGIL